MCATSKRRYRSVGSSRGVALVFTLLLLTLLMALSLGMAIAIGSQTFIAGYYRNYRGAFYAADSGANVGRQAMLNGILADVPVNFAVGTAPISAAAPAAIQSSVATAYANWITIDSGQAAGSWPESFKLSNVTFGANATTPCTVAYTYTGPSPQPTPIPTYTCASPPTGNYTATSYTYLYSYSVTSLGEVKNNEQASITDAGNIQITVNVGAATGVKTNFSAWGMFINNASECDGTTLVNGSIYGPVATNGGFTFNTSTYNFSDPVTFGASTIGYSGMCPTTTATYPEPGYSALKFNSGITLNYPSIPLPANDFSQKWAVLDGLGQGEGSSAPTAAQMNAVLKSVSATVSGTATAVGTPYPSSGASSGVFLPYTTTTTASCPTAPCITGGGIYVEGNATSVLLKAATGACPCNPNPSAGSNPLQIFQIVQGSSTTTITEDLTAQTTTISNGTTSQTIHGIPEDYNGSPAFAATMLYVDGSIGSSSGSTGLSGPESSSGGTVASSGAAIQNNSEITITAAGDVNITGDITYATEPITMPGDALVSLPTNASTQVLGIFTATGEVNLNNQQNNNCGSNECLEIDAAVAAISAGATNGIQNVGNAINTLNIVGGRIQSSIQNINTTTRNVYFDRRFLQGSFGPPWFPSTTLTPGGVSGATATAKVFRLQWTNNTATLN